MFPLVLGFVKLLFFKPKCSSVQKHKYISVSKNCTANWAKHKKMDSGNKNFLSRPQPDEINTDFQLLKTHISFF